MLFVVKFDVAEECTTALEEFLAVRILFLFFVSNFALEALQFFQDLIAGFYAA